MKSIITQKIEVASRTDRGRMRTDNQDAFLFMDQHNLFMVADGVGGQNSGALASKLAVDAVEAYMKANLLSEVADPKTVKNYFLDCLQAVNALIIRKANQSPLNSGMATTALLAYIRCNLLYVMNIGDSRAYLVRDGEVSQITEDHTLVNELLKTGSITREEADNHPDGHVITRALGCEEKTKPDFYQVQLHEDDRILLCTDGLYKEIQIDQLRDMVEKNQKMDVLAEELIKSANINGGMDNITAICIKVLELKKEKEHE